jgi:hypothetical protein
VQIFNDDDDDDDDDDVMRVFHDWDSHTCRPIVGSSITVSADCGSCLNGADVRAEELKTIARALILRLACCAIVGSSSA